MAADYDLILMLDPEAPEERRAQIADEVRKLIESDGTVKRSDEWGMRKMAFEIRHRVEADYRYFQFEAESPVLERLNHTLKISDGVLRFRTIRLDPRMPPAPDVGAMPVVTGGVRDETRGRRGEGRGEGRGEDRGGGGGSSPAAEPSVAAEVSEPAEPASEVAAEPVEAAVDESPSVEEGVVVEAGSDDAGAAEAQAEPEAPAAG